MIEKVSLSEKFSLIQDYWNPRIAGRINDFAVKLVKLYGEFVWHQHDIEDELFLVVKGTLKIELRDGELILNAGEFAIIPHGVEHRPVAEQEVEVLLLEPLSTLNTGDAEDDSRTVRDLKSI